MPFFHNIKTQRCHGWLWRAPAGCDNITVLEAALFYHLALGDLGVSALCQTPWSYITKWAKPTEFIAKTVRNPSAASLAGRLWRRRVLSFCLPIIAPCGGASNPTFSWKLPTALKVDTPWYLGINCAVWFGANWYMFKLLGVQEFPSRTCLEWTHSEFLVRWGVLSPPF